MGRFGRLGPVLGLSAAWCGVGEEIDSDLLAFMLVRTAFGVGRDHGIVACERRDGGRYDRADNIGQ